jgi:hypothetical protein
MRWVVVLVVAAACNKGPSEDQCKQALDKLVDLEFKKGGSTAVDVQKTELERQKEDVVKSKQDTFMAACMQKTARERVDCVLSATTLDCPDDKKDCQSVARCDNTEAQ